MEELVNAGGSACVADQILYKLIRRGPEHDRLRWPEEVRYADPLMAASEQNR